MTDAATITPDAAVKRLTTLAEQYTALAKIGPKSCRASYVLDAAAIRWVLALTSFPLDDEAGPDQ